MMTQTAHDSITRDAATVAAEFADRLADIDNQTANDRYVGIEEDWFANDRDSVLIDIQEWQNAGDYRGEQPDIVHAVRRARQAAWNAVRP